MKTLLLTLLTLNCFAETTYKDVEPVIKNHCLSCHAADVRSAGVNLEGYNELLDYVVPGELAESDLWIAIASGNMPIGTEMTAEEKKLIKTWIVEGALPAREE